MKKLSESELEIMMIIWNKEKPVNRYEIEEDLEAVGRNLAPSTVLSFLSRLEKKGVLEVGKQGKTNIYTPLITKNEYVKVESKSIFKKMYDNSVKNFMTALYDGDLLGEKDIQELKEFIEEKEKK